MAVSPNPENEQDTNCDSCGLPTKTALAFEQMRKDFADEKARNEALSGLALSNGILAAGFELTDEKGETNKLLSLVTEAFLKEHPEVEKFDPAKFTEFAAAYNVAPKGAAEGSGEPTTPDDQGNVLASLEAQGSTLRNATTPATTPKGPDVELSEAQAKGDWETVKRLNNRKVVEGLLASQ